MALKDLIINQKQVSEELIENILKDNVELINDTSGVQLTRQGLKFSNKTRLLLYLTGKKAWEIINNTEEKNLATRDELMQAVDIIANTIGPILTDLKDENLITVDKAKYSITPKGIINVEDWLKTDKVKEKPAGKGQKKANKSSPSGGRPEFLKAFAEKEMSQEYFEKLSPVIHKTKQMGRFLLAIHIGKEYYGLKGLTATEINTLLTEPPLKFPKMYPSNISRDLGNEKKLLISYKSGKSHEYRLTTFGDQEVAKILTNTTEENAE